MEKVQVSLGDVSLNKLMFVIAYEEGIYKKNGLEVEQFIKPSAAEIVKHSGVTVPQEFIRSSTGETPIEIGGGCPLMVRWATDAEAVDRVILACTDPIVRWHIVSRSDIANMEQLKGKRLGYSGYGAVTHFIAIAFAKIMGWDPSQPYPSVEGIKKVMEIYDYHEMRKYKPEYFYDDSFIRQLDPSGYIDSLYQ